MADISGKQTRAISALLTSRTNSEAAQKAGISERALYRWLKEDDFRLALDKAEANLVEDVTRRLASLMGQSIDELEKLLQSGITPPGDRLRAIRTVLDIYPRLRELTSLDIRIERLERELENDD